MDNDCQSQLFVGASAKQLKNNYLLRHVSVFCPQGNTRLPMHGFSWNLIFEYFSKIFPQNSGFIIIQQEQRVPYMKTYIHLLSYLAEFVTQCQMCHTKVIEQNTHCMFSSLFFLKIIPWMRCGKYCSLDRPQMTIWRTRFACWILEATNTHLKYVILITFPQ